VAGRANKPETFFSAGIPLLLPSKLPQDWGAMQVTTKHSTQTLVSGRWITERQYAELHSISRQTLSNWRFRDRRAGRSSASPGYPVYRRFGRAVRYYLIEDSQQ